MTEVYVFKKWYGTGRITKFTTTLNNYRFIATSTDSLVVERRITWNNGMDSWCYHRAYTKAEWARTEEEAYAKLKVLMDKRVDYLQRVVERIKNMEVTVCDVS